MDKSPFGSDVMLMLVVCGENRDSGTLTGGDRNTHTVGVSKDLITHGHAGIQRETHPHTLTHLCQCFEGRVMNGQQWKMCLSCGQICSSARETQLSSILLQSSRFITALPKWRPDGVQW